MSKIDLNDVWDDARAMGRVNKDLLIAIAGMFVLLPGVIADQLLVVLPDLPRDAQPDAMMQRMTENFTANWPVLLGHALVTTFGTLAMLTLLLRPERLTVGESLKAALIVLPSYFIASLIQGAVAGFGLFFFLLPGLYIIARLILIAPIAAAEGTLNPIEMITRSFALTRGNGWRIFALLAILFSTALVVGLVINVLVGLLVGLLLPAEVGQLVLSIASGLFEAALVAAVVLINAALYRAATHPIPTPWLS